MYDDIVDWTEENEPMELFDSFTDFVKAVQADFSRHGHYFPPSVIKDLAEEWEERFDTEVGEEELREEQIKAEIAQAKTTQAEFNITRNHRLSPKDTVRLRQEANRGGIALGKRLQRQDLQKEIARKIKRQDEYIRKAKQQQRKSRALKDSKRKIRRQKGKEKERKKRGKR